MRGSGGAGPVLRRLCETVFSSPFAARNRRFVSAIPPPGDGFDPVVGTSLSTWPLVDGLRSQSPSLQPLRWRQPVVSMSSQAALEDKPEPESGSPEVERLYKELTETVAKRRMPDASKLPSLLQNCANPVDVKLALDAAAALRNLKAVQGQQKANYSGHMAQLMVEACIRSGDPLSGLKTLWKKNQYGFTPSIEQAHLLFKHALEQKDTRLMLKIMQTMVTNNLRPTPGSADYIIRICKESGNIELLLKVAKELQMNGVVFKKALYDVVISCAANVGDVTFVHEVQAWREDQKFDHTTASAFSLAKALVLDGKSQEAAELISEHCKDVDKRDIYLSIMVKSWPLEVAAKLEEERKGVFLQELKEKVVAFCESLTELGCRVPGNVSEDFGKGKGSSSKAQVELHTPHS